VHVLGVADRRTVIAASRACSRVCHSGGSGRLAVFPGCGMTGLAAACWLFGIDQAPRRSRSAGSGPCCEAPGCHWTPRAPRSALRSVLDGLTAVLPVIDPPIIVSRYRFRISVARMTHRAVQSRGRRSAARWESRRLTTVIALSGRDGASTSYLAGAGYSGCSDASALPLVSRGTARGWRRLPGTVP
jgi:hypothetical protein